MDHPEQGSGPAQQRVGAQRLGGRGDAGDEPGDQRALGGDERHHLGTDAEGRGPAGCLLLVAPVDAEQLGVLAGSAHDEALAARAPVVERDPVVAVGDAAVEGIDRVCPARPAGHTIDQVIHRQGLDRAQLCATASRSASMAASSSALPWILGPVNHLRADRNQYPNTNTSSMASATGA